MSTGGIAPGSTGGIVRREERQEIVERILDDLDRLSRAVRPEQYVHVLAAADAIRELAAELNVDVCA